VRKVLPVLREVYEKSGTYDWEMEEYPVEGYYYKSKELTEVFQRVRNLQQNKKIYDRVNRDWDELVYLRGIYESELFGVKHMSYYPWPDAPLQRRWDALTRMMSDDSIVNQNSTKPWSIPFVMEHLSKYLNGQSNLVELAGLIGKPILLTCAAETNSLGRMYSFCSGACSIEKPVVEYVWKVSPKVEVLGRKIAVAYNEMMKGFYIKMPDPNNCWGFDWDTPELPRVAHLGYVMATRENYFWIVDRVEEVFDYYTADFITTKNVQSKGIINNFGRKAV
jgi:hypothetical protein